MVWAVSALISGVVEREQNMKHLHVVGVEEPVLTFPCFLEFYFPLFMSAPLDREPGSSRLSTSGVILPKRN